MRVTGCGWRTAVHSAGISRAPPRCRQSDNGDSMIGLAAYVAFLGVSLLVICTPGQDTALTIRNTLLGRRRAGIATAFGVAAGQAIWTVATSAGLAVGFNFCLLTLAWLVVYAFAVERMSGWLRRGEVRRVIDGLLGAVLVGLGLRVTSQALAR